MGDVLVRFARCCSPLPGDEVVGFITRGRGVTVHVKDCSKVFELDPERRVDVEWDSAVSGPRRIKVRVHSLDKPGLLANVTNTISEAGINIEGARVTTTRDQKALHSFDLAVADVKSLNAVMKKIERIKGVLSVERLRS
jgi:GTP pyrophosphokinase